MTPLARRRWRRLLLAMSIVGLALFGWGFVWEPARLLVTTQALAVPDWPVACTGLRVAVVTDLHVGAPHVGIDKLDRVVATVQRQSPDIVLLTGDFVIDGVIGGQWVSPETIAQHLQPLAKDGRAYAVLGNHDWWLDAGRVRRALEDAGIPVLEDASVPIAIGRCRGDHRRTAQSRRCRYRSPAWLSSVRVPPYIARAWIAPLPRGYRFAQHPITKTRPHRCADE